MHKVFKHLPMLAIAIMLGAGSARATIAVEVFSFTGNCMDCTGTGTAELILLAGYMLGTPLSADDLVSFNYTSNLIPELSIHNDPTAVLMGSLPIGLGPADVFISGMDGSFSSAADGTWSAFDPPADMGTNGVWAAGSPVATPEPATLSLIGIGVAGMFWFRLRQSVR